MKRITVLLLALVMSFSAAGGAMADGIDVKVKGQWDFAFGLGINTNLYRSVNNDDPPPAPTKVKGAARKNDNFIARQRIRTQVDFIASEHLAATLMFEIGNIDWGRNGVGRHSGGQLDADGVNIATKRAYVDWIIPNTDISVRMGIQQVALPSTPMGSALFDTDVAAVVVSSPLTDWLAVSALWMRPMDQYGNDNDAGFGLGRRLSDEVDAWGLLLPMWGNGWTFTPWAAYSLAGANSGLYDYVFACHGEGVNSVSRASARTQAFWIGAHSEISILDPLVLNLEGMYGHLKPQDLDGFGEGLWPFAPNGLEKGGVGGNGLNTNLGSQGWFFAATLDYKMDWMTPGLFGWWASGDKARSDYDGKYGRVPILGNGNDGGAFHPTSFGLGDGAYGIGDHAVIAGSGTGTWGIGLQFKDMTFVEDLSHTLRFAYYRGTNDHELIARGGTSSRYTVDNFYLTDKDYVMEVNFDHTYRIYENLTAVLELGWLRLHSDKETWKGQYAGGNMYERNKENQNAWKAQLNFRYQF